jgi:hypothetical protein
MRLEKLELQGKDVTDAGLAHLQGMKQLKNLDLTFTKVTEAGVDGLNRTRPDTDISWVSEVAAGQVKQKSVGPSYHR